MYTDINRQPHKSKQRPPHTPHSSEHTHTHTVTRTHIHTHQPTHVHNSSPTMPTLGHRKKKDLFVLKGSPVQVQLRKEIVKMSLCSRKPSQGRDTILFTTTYTPRASARLLSLSTSSLWNWIILCCRGCPVHCRMLNSILSLYKPDASHVVTTKIVSGCCPLSLADITPSEEPLM